MQVTIDSYQALIGSATPFFELDPNSFLHKLDATMTKITFVWESLFAISASLKIAKQWIPKLQFQNDMAIIDAIVAIQREAAGTSAFIPNQQILSSNVCRLWLQISVLSDASGQHIMDWAMYGTAQNNILW